MWKLARDFVVMFVVFVLIWALIGYRALAYADEGINRYDNVILLSVYDGDTLKVEIEIWPGHWVETSVRVNGIDAPEIRTKTRCEKNDGLYVRDYLQEWIGDQKIQITNVQIGKYAGRILGDVIVGGESDVAGHLLAKGYVDYYNGGTRPQWVCKDLISP